MESEQRRKRKRSPKLQSNSHYSLLFSRSSLLLCFSFLVFILFLSSNPYPGRMVSFRPVLNASTYLLLPSSTSNSIVGPLGVELISSPLRVDGRVQFPDQLLLLVSNRVNLSESLECVYYKSDSDGSDELRRPAIWAGEYNEYRSIVRCPLPPANFSLEADLRRQGDGRNGLNSSLSDRAVHTWDKVVYEAALDSDTVAVFVKGLNLRPHRMSDPTPFSCHFGLGSWEKDDTLMMTTKAISAAQEVIRCSLPLSIRNDPSKAQGVRVTIGFPPNFHTHGRSSTSVPMPSVARIYSFKGISEVVRKEMKHQLCACTMLWNQAANLHEWMMYHAWLGIGRWFIYDNNSDDAIEDVIKELNLQNYNVSRQVWPWIKTQEAGFSHCVLRARDECEWIGFFDVDEFFYFPYPSRNRRAIGIPGKNSLSYMVANFSSSSEIVGEIRTTCHNFGPSGLTSPPAQGVMVGYTCRLKQPERHKSIVRPDALDLSLLNEVHHFRLKDGFRTLNVPESFAVVNHYKYQVWETFRTKFYRRVATYVADWQENQNQGSRDRAPGLGTEAIEPPNWRLQFCEVWDTGLRDFVLANFAEPARNVLPWQRSHR